MSISLEKGQKVDLTKTNPNVRNFRVGLGWNANSAASGHPFDIDASAFILNSAGKMLSDQHFVFYNNLKSPEEFVTHTGDNLNGEGDGDDETILLDFIKAPAEAEKVSLIVTIHGAAEKSQNFGQIEGAFVRILDDATGEEILKYDLSEDFSVETAVAFGTIYKKDGEWKFQADGIGKKGGLQEYLTQYS